MIAKEAYERLGTIMRSNQFTRADKTAMTFAIIAVMAKIPTKPYNRCKLGEKTVIGTCPNCGDGCNSEYPYCSKCGQALDWSDEQ